LRHTGVFMLASLGVMAAAGGLLLLVFPGRHSATAIAASAAVALLVQLVAFTILRRLRGQTVFIGWGIGSVLRLAALGCYALLLGRGTALPVVPGLISLATFLFATMVLEPLLLDA
jgi:hypothetical protein